MLNAAQIAIKLETIATSLNEADRSAGDYNHFEHFCQLCFEQELEVDHEQQEDEDEGAAYTLFAVRGSLHYSDAFHVDYDSIVEDNGLAIGDEVCGGTTRTEDYDEGTVMALRQGEAEVAWDGSNETTWSPAETLRPVGDDDEFMGERVEVETMPEYLRASHEAAGNRGWWPHNGAVRKMMSTDEADELVAADPNWSSIVEA